MENEENKVSLEKNDNEMIMRQMFHLIRMRIMGSRNSKMLEIQIRMAIRKIHGTMQDTRM